MSMRVLVTRPREDSVALEAELRRMGIDVALEPMLKVRRLKVDTVDVQAVQGLLFTSSNGVRAFESVSAERSVPAYCVGDETARTAGAAGFSTVHSAAGNVEKLAEYVASKAHPRAGRMIHITGSVTAGDLAGRLGDAGFTVERIPLYEAVAATELSEETQQALKKGLLDAVLFFSPRTAATFVSVAKKAGLEEACRTVEAVCLSAAVAERVSGLPWRRTVVASEPTRAALLASLEQG